MGVVGHLWGICLNLALAYLLAGSRRAVLLRCKKQCTRRARRSVLEEQFLNPARHNRNTFSLRMDVLDVYLQRLAVQQSKKGVALVRVLGGTDAPNTILGFYSLSAAQIDVKQFDLRTSQKLPRYPIPCFCMGRLANHIDHRGHGLGCLLVACAIERCIEVRKQMGAYALVVDAKGMKPRISTCITDSWRATTSPRRSTCHGVHNSPCAPELQQASNKRAVAG